MKALSETKRKVEEERMRLQQLQEENEQLKVLVKQKRSRCAIL